MQTGKIFFCNEAQSPSNAPSKKTHQTTKNQSPSPPPGEGRGEGEDHAEVKRHHPTPRAAFLTISNPSTPMKPNKPFFFGADSTTFSKAKRLRKPLTRAENLLWQALRNRQLNGFKFRRQHPAGPYIADFFCAAAMIVVEVDGTFHDLPEAKEHDDKRRQFFSDNGVKVIRFRNEAVMINLPGVLEEIRLILASRTSSIKHH